MSDKENPSESFSWKEYPVHAQSYQNFIYMQPDMVQSSTETPLPSIDDMISESISSAAGLHQTIPACKDNFSREYSGQNETNIVEPVDTGGEPHFQSFYRQVCKKRGRKPKKKNVQEFETSSAKLSVRIHKRLGRPKKSK